MVVLKAVVAEDEKRVFYRNALRALQFVEARSNTHGAHHELA